MKLLLCCTKQPPYLYGNPFILKTEFDHYCLVKQKNAIFGEDNLLNGKIVAECDFEVEEIKNYTSREKGTFYSWYEYKGLNIGDEDCELLKDSCLTFDEISDYLLANNGYAIYIKNLHIFDEPRELKQYRKIISKISSSKYAYYVEQIDESPKNMMYVFDDEGEKKVLISIHPERLVKLLDGECTIILKKKVLKRMI